MGEHSYLTQTPEGQVCKRNRKHLRATNEEPSLISENTNSDTALPPGSTETEIHENVTNMDANKPVTNPDDVLKSSEQEESFVDDTPQGRYMTTRSGRSVKPPIRYQDYTNTL